MRTKHIQPTETSKTFSYKVTTIKHLHDRDQLYSKTKISPERFQRHTYVHMGRKEGRKEVGAWRNQVRFYK